MGFQVPSTFTARDRVTGPMRTMTRSTKNFAVVAVNSFHRVDRVVVNTNRNIQGLTGSFGNLAAAAGLGFGARELLTLQEEFGNTRRTLMQFGVTGNQQLPKVTAQVQAISDTFKEEVNPILIATNALAKGMDIPFTQATKAMEEGFINGLNANNEFLDTVREYSPLMKEAGLTTTQFMNLIQTSVNQGIFSDKGIDVIKEANIRIREMTPATAKAIDAMGLSSRELQKGLQDGSLTTIDVIQKVSKQMGTLPPAGDKVGAALADIFGGPGEDAGLQFILSLENLKKAAENIPPALREVNNNQRRLLQANKLLNSELDVLFTQSKKEFLELKILGIQLMVELVRAIKPVVQSLLNFISNNREAVKSMVAFAAKAFIVVKALFWLSSILFKIFIVGKKVVGFFKKAITAVVRFFRPLHTMFAVNRALRFASALRSIGVAFAFLSGPVGWIIGAVVALTVLVTQMVKHWDEWGAAVAAILGPLGFVVSLVQSFRKHWELLTRAFQVGGLKAAIKSIGLILIDAVLKPMEAILGLFAKIPGMGQGFKEIQAARLILQRNLEVLAGPAPATPVAPVVNLPQAAQLPAPGQPVNDLEVIQNDGVNPQLIESLDRLNETIQQAIKNRSLPNEEEGMMNTTRDPVGVRTMRSF